MPCEFHCTAVESISVAFCFLYPLLLPCLLQCDNLAAAAQHMQVPAEHLQQQLERYNTAAAAAAAGGRGDEFGKQYFPTTFDTNGHLWVGQITPVVHYCMGGLEINEKAQVCAGVAVRGVLYPRTWRTCVISLYRL